MHYVFDRQQSSDAEGHERYARNVGADFEPEPPADTPVATTATDTDTTHDDDDDTTHDDDDGTEGHRLYARNVGVQFGPV